MHSVRAGRTAASSSSDLRDAEERDGMAHAQRPASAARAPNSTGGRAHDRRRRRRLGDLPATSRASCPAKKPLNRLEYLSNTVLSRNVL